MNLDIQGDVYISEPDSEGVRRWSARFACLNTNDYQLWIIAKPLSSIFQFIGHQVMLDDISIAYNNATSDPQMWQLAVYTGPTILQVAELEAWYSDHVQGAIYAPVVYRDLNLLLFSRDWRQHLDDAAVPLIDTTGQNVGAYTADDIWVVLRGRIL